MPLRRCLPVLLVTFGCWLRKFYRCPLHPGVRCDAYLANALSALTRVPTMLALSASKPPSAGTSMAARRMAKRYGPKTRYAA